MKWKWVLKRNKEKFFLGFDIGTEAVKALIFCAYKDKVSLENKITILGTGIKYFDKGSIFDNRDFRQEVMKDTISKAFEEAKQNLSFSLGRKDLKKRALNQKKWKVLVGLPADILKARVVHVSFLRDTDKKISKKERRDICHSVIKSAKEKIGEQFAREFGILPDDLHWNSLKILGTKIDGYIVSNLDGYRGKKMQFKILATFLPKYYMNNMEKIIEPSGFKVLKLVHLAQTLPIVCKRKKNTGLFLDVGGEITQIIEMKAGQLKRIDEFKGGGRAFTRSLSDTLGLDKRTVRIMNENYSKGLLSKSVIKRIKEIFSWERKIWYNDLKAKLKIMSSKGTFPSIFFLFGGTSACPEIQGVLEETGVDDWRNLPIYNPPKVGFLNPEDLENIKDETKVFNKLQTVPSLLICYGIFN